MKIYQINFKNFLLVFSFFVMKKILFSEYVKNIKGFLKYEEPNSNIHIFNGRLKLESFPRASDIKDDNFVMRGSTIKNIPFDIYLGLRNIQLRDEFNIPLKEYNFKFTKFFTI